MVGGYTDPVLSHRARQDVLGERDHLLKRANQNSDVKRFVPSEGGSRQDRARVTLITLVMSFFGVVPYGIMLFTWFYVYHASFVQTLVTFAGFIGLGMFFVVASHKRALGKDRAWMRWFGAVLLQATVVGCVVGFLLYFQYLAYFWKYEEMRTYTNVAAAQDSNAFGDGDMFLFTEDTRLDVMRSVGFKSRWTGETFCVAPLVDVTMNQANEINYWVVGTDCCGARTDFVCGDAEDFSTRSALRVLEPEDVARSFMRWAVRRGSYQRYMDAVRLQEGTYATKSATRPTLVWWSKDPVSLKRSFYTDAVDVCVKVSWCYFALVIVGVYFIAWNLTPQQRHEGVIRK